MTDIYMMSSIIYIVKVIMSKQTSKNTPMERAEHVQIESPPIVESVPSVSSGRMLYGEGDGYHPSNDQLLLGQGRRLR